MPGVFKLEVAYYTKATVMYKDQYVVVCGDETLNLPTTGEADIRTPGANGDRYADEWIL